MSTKAIREHLVQLSLRLDALRRERDDLDRRIDAYERELDALVGGSEGQLSPSHAVLVEGRTSPFVQKVLYLLRDHPGAPVASIVDRLGKDDSNVKRVHNALVTLQRQGRVERVGRGRWKAVELTPDTVCEQCGTRFSKVQGPCPSCNVAVGDRAGGAGDL